MRPIRVFVVDDSAVTRNLLRNILAADPEIEIAGLASSGHIALARIPEVRPDLVTLDIEMAGLDGLATLVEIRKRDAMLPVIMFSSLTEHGATVTLEALARGASEYVTKPTGALSAEAAREQVRTDLIPKIKSLFAVRRPHAQPVLAPAMAPPRAPSCIDVVAIASSTGGPNALSTLIPQLPPDFPVPIVVVQHMPPLYTRLLAERLHKLSRVVVREGEEGRKLQAGDVWIAPGDRHMVVARNGKHVVLGLNQNPPENSCRPAADALFSSVAQVYGANTLSVVMTGMGSDGTRGARLLREAGGEVIVQDEASSVVWGMPGSVVAAGQADRIFPLAELAPELVRRVRASRRANAAFAAARTR